MKITLFIIAYTIAIIAGLTALSLVLSDPNYQKPKTMKSGIDAAGFKHYPDGTSERMEIRF